MALSCSLVVRAHKKEPLLCITRAQERTIVVGASLITTSIFIVTFMQNLDSHNAYSLTYNHILNHLLLEYTLYHKSTRKNQCCWCNFDHNLHFQWHIHPHLCKTQILTMRRHSPTYNLPSQPKSSSARVYPVLQEHKKEPLLLVQF